MVRGGFPTPPDKSQRSRPRMSGGSLTDLRHPPGTLNWGNRPLNCPALSAQIDEYKARGIWEVVTLWSAQALR